MIQWKGVFHCRGGAKGPWPRPPGQGCPNKSHKVPWLGHIFRRECPSCDTYCRRSDPGGQILWKKCPIRGKSCGKRAPCQEIHRRFLPHIFFWSLPHQNSVSAPALTFTTHNNIYHLYNVVQRKNLKNPNKPKGRNKCSESLRKTIFFQWTMVHVFGTFSFNMAFY